MSRYAGRLEMGVSLIVYSHLENIFKRKKKEEVNLQENREEKFSDQTAQDGFNATSHMDNVFGICIQTILWEFKSDVGLWEWLENVEN